MADTPETDEEILPFEEEAESPYEEEEVSLPDHPYEPPVIKEIALSDIQPLDNVRSTDHPPATLTENIRVQGLLHPIVVRPVENKPHGKPYELIVGYRRLRAFETLGWETIPASVHAASDQQVLAELISENLQREDPSPLDEAKVMQRMIDTFGWSHAQVAAQLGVDRSQVTKRLGLLRLPEKVRDMVAEGSLTASHAEVVARLDSPDQQEELAELAVRLDTPVAKLNNYASKIKAEQHEEEISEIAAPDEETPMVDPPEEEVELVAVELPRLEVREIEGRELRQAELYMILRSANDIEMLEWLEVECGADYGSLWEWVLLLDDQQLDHMISVMTRRFLGAAHRYPTLPSALISSLGGGGTPSLEELPAIALDYDQDYPEDYPEDEL